MVTDYGLPAGQVMPTAIWDSAYPYRALNQNTALSLALAQYNSRDNLAQVNAGLQGDAMRANASVAGAQIGANASAYGSQVSALAQLAATNADAATRVLVASGGDRNAANRLAAELLMQASGINSNVTMELGRRAGSGDLRENFGRMLALAGQGSMPGAFSAMGGLPSPFVTAPGVNFSEYGTAPTASLSLPAWSAGSAPSYSAPQVTGGNMDIEALFASLYGGMPQMNDLGAGGNQPVAPAAPVAPVGAGGEYNYQGTYMPTSAINAIGLDQGLGALNTALYGSGQGMSHGGTISLGKNEAVQVGEGVDGSGVRAGTAEIMKPVGTNSMRVMPQIAPGIELYRDPETGQQYDASGARSAATGGEFKSFWGAQSKPMAYSPLQRYQQTMTDAAAAKANAEATMATPEPAPTPTDIAASTTPAYDAGLGAGAPLPATEPGQLMPGGPKVTDLPFYQALMSGKAGPAWNANIQRPTAPELGINEGVPLPFERSNVYQRSDPIQQQAMSQFWSFLGIPEAMQRFWINQSTPGYRANQQQALGF